MPAISTRFNRFFTVLLLQFAFVGPLQAQLPTLSDEQLLWLGQQVYRNECNNRPACLTAWNAGEDFPSLGIGHFIWFPRGATSPFEETFPALIRSMQDRGADPPGWLLDTIDSGAPWSTRDQFQEQIDSSKMGQLRRFLLQTQDLQVQFIAHRLYREFPAILAAAPASERESLRRRFNSLAASSPPYGLYALIDYVHFKGTGLNAGERYQGQGWGLLQVLLAMPEEDASIDAFIRVAGATLARRVANAPRERSEERWLQGWRNRLETYRAP